MILKCSYNNKSDFWKNLIIKESKHGQGGS